MILEHAESIVSIWLDAFAQDPEHPSNTEAFQHLADMLDGFINHILDQDAAQPSDLLDLDKILSQAFSILNGREDAEDATIPFLHEVLPYFENLTFFDDKTQSSKIAFLLTVPVIGMQEAALDLAQKAQGLRLEEAWTKTGILPPKAKVLWNTTPSSAVQYSEWLAYDRLRFLQQALDQPQEFERARIEYSADGIDRADLRMLLGVVVMTQEDFNQAMKMPAFLFADLQSFEFEGVRLHPDFPSESFQKAVQDRSVALEKSIEILTQKMVRAGIEHTAMGEPGQVKDGLLELLAWSLHVQQMHELQALKLNESQALQLLQEGTAHIAVDVDKNQLVLMIQKDDRIVGPVSTDFPWKQMSVNDVLNKLQEMNVVPQPEKAILYPNAAIMVAAVRGASSRFRPH